MPNNVQLKNKGLHTFANSLSELPPGSLRTAKNIVLNRDSIIEPRRGFALYGDGMGAFSKTGLVYKGRILRHFNNTLQFDTLVLNGSNQSIFSSFAGSYTEPSAGTRIKSIESNSNFYFTTSTGIKKISATQASDLNVNSITDAGGVAALDTRVTLNSQAGWFTQDSVVAYRIVWGIKDANQNLILGSPSSRTVIFNALTDLLITDFNNLLTQTDTLNVSSGISDGNYHSSLAITPFSPASTVREELLALTAKLDNDIPTFTTTTGVAEVQSFQTRTDGVPTSLNSQYFTINSGGNFNKYYVWYTDGGGVDPSISDRIGIKVTFTTGDIDTTIASLTATALQTVADFTASSGGTNVVTVTNTVVGSCIQAATGTSGFTLFTVVIQGGGGPTVTGSNPYTVTWNVTTDPTNIISVGDAIGVTGVTPTTYDSPTSPASYFTTSNITENSGTITTITIANPTHVTSTAHGLLTGDQITISGSNSTPSIDGLRTITFIDANTFSVPVNVTVAGTAGSWTQYKISYTQTTNPGSYTSGTAIISRKEFEAITQPEQLSLVPTSEQLISLQTYYDAIVSALQNDPSGITGNFGTITTNTVANPTIVTSVNHGLTGTPTIVISGSNSTPSIDGSHIATVLTANTFSIPVNVTVAGTSGSWSFTSTFANSNSTQSSTTDVSFTIPQGITTIHFYQIYRTPLTTSTGVNSLSDLDPGDEEQLVYEANPVAADIAAGTISVHDITPESFLGANLYTNPNSGEGILNANEVPPLAVDMTLFKGFTFFANTQTKYQLQINLLSVLQLTPNVSTLTITNGSVSNTYTFSTSENTATKKVLISTLPTPAQQVDETARSLVHVINLDPNSDVYAFYLSGPSDVPGIILLKAKDLGGVAFIVSTNSLATGSQFSPNLAPTNSITSIVASGSTDAQITSATHGLTTGNSIVISGSNSTPIVDGIFTVVVLDANNFTIPIPSPITVSGNSGGWQLTTSANIGDNQVSPNGLYYSKQYQPEAVPIINNIPVGPKDKKILRILALRDSLFILKEDAIYRLSGESAPFIINLFDSSALLKASDSAVVLNNLIYGYSTQGVIRISDTGVEVMSRDIEDIILPLSSLGYTNFSTATSGTAYESDRSYYLWTVTNPTDTTATQCFRYNTFTNTWSIYDKAATFGIVNPANDKLYTGAVDVGFIDQERKNFDLSDYADREFGGTLADNSVNGTSIVLGVLSNVEVGDVLGQTQYLTIYQYNQLLLMLDADTHLEFNDYYSTLIANPGNNLRTLLSFLAQKLDTDSGINTHNYVSSISGFGTTFIDTQDAYNTIVTNLNTDTGTGFKNYPSSSGTTFFETVISGVFIVTGIITTFYPYQFIAGPVTIYKSFECVSEWAPQFMGDASMSKHIRDGTIIFENNSFTSAFLAYSTDLNPEYSEISFLGKGTGVYGNNPYGGPNNFGGSSNGAPMRTLIPLAQQRGRYINCRFRHKVARESFAIKGISQTYENVSTRAYK